MRAPLHGLAEAGHRSLPVRYPPEDPTQRHRSREPHHAGLWGQIIVAAAVTDEPNDKQQAQPLLAQVLVNTGHVPRLASLDAGYFSEANVTALAALGCTLLIPPDRQLYGRAVPVAPRGRPSAGLSVADRMRRTLRTKPGRRLYARRKAIVEPVLGQIKQGRGFRQLLLRGMRKVWGE